jgi:hypothetical protein
MLTQSDPPDRVFLQSLTDELDAYLFYTEGLRSRPAVKPRMKLPNKFRRLIEFMDHEAMDGFIEASIALLELDGKGRKQIPARMEQMRRRSARDQRPHNMSLVFSQPETCGITVMSAPEALAREELAKLPRFCELKKYQLRAARWAGFGVVEGERGPVQAIVVRYGEWEKDPAADRTLEQLGWDAPEH